MFHLTKKGEQNYDAHEKKPTLVAKYLQRFL